MKHSKDIQKLLRPVYYFAGGLYYQVDSCSKNKLINKQGKLKNFIVLDVTESVIYSNSDFLIKFNLIDQDGKYDSGEVIQFLDVLRFKVYRKIKCQ